MKERGGLEQRTQAGTKLITHQQLPPPMDLNAFFRSPSASAAATPSQSPHIAAMAKAAAHQSEAPEASLGQSPNGMPMSIATSSQSTSWAHSRPVATTDPNDGPMAF
jgi:hypothetical protein